MSPSADRAALDVWTIEIDSAVGCEQRLGALLDAGERARADRFVRLDDALRYRVAHGALRTILGACTQIAPAQLSFDVGEHGRPLLAGGPHFSLSHSANLALVAVSRAREVGVDVEQIRAVPDAGEIAQSYLADEPARRIARAPAGDRDRLFMRGWTAIEAVLKAEGTGLTGPEQRFELREIGDDRARARVVGMPGSPTWTVRWLALAPGYAGAVATRGSDEVELRAHRFA